MDVCILQGKSVTPKMPGACSRCGLYLNTCSPIIENGFLVGAECDYDFVVTVRIMKIVDGRKEIFMKEKIVKRMEQELNEYREYLVSGKLTAQKILEEAYQLVIKQELYYIFENHNCSRLSEEELNWMNQQNNMLDAQ